MPEQMEKEEIIKKQKFYKDFIQSIIDFEKFEDFAIEGVGRTLKYFAKILLIFCIIICIAYTYKITKNINNIYLKFKDTIPDFSYISGELKTENTDAIIIEDYGETIGSIIIDTNTESGNAVDDYKEQIEKYGSAILFLKNKIIVINPALNGQATYKYSDLFNVQECTKNQLINYIEGLNKVSVIFTIFFIMLISLLMVYFIAMILDVLLLAFSGYISARFFRLKIKFNIAFSVAVHALTLPIILNLLYIIINLFTGFEVKYFQVMYYTVAYIYVIMAVILIKTDFINRQIELMRIAEEQMKIEDELENQEENDKKEDKDQDPIQQKEKENEEPVIPNEPKNKKRKNNKEKTPDNPIGDASSTVHDSE